MKTLYSRAVLLPSALIAAFYVILITYLPNMSLVGQTLLGAHTLLYKLTVLVALIGGLWTANTPPGVVLLVLTSFFTGMNLTLIMRRYTRLKKQGQTRFTVGLSSFLGIIGHGCSACGLPILVFLGLGGSLSFLPFKGTELSYISFLAVVGTFILLARGLGQENETSCSACSVSPEARSEKPSLCQLK